MMCDCPGGEVIYLSWGGGGGGGGYISIHVQGG